jgi:hypothetical protein
MLGILLSPAGKLTRCMALLLLLATAHTPAMSHPSGDAPPQFFRQFCFDCHGETKAKGHFNFERLAAQASVGPQA